MEAAGSRKLKVIVVAAAVAVACASPTEPGGNTADFVVEAGGERFVLRTSDPATIRLATDNLEGRNQRFPSGPLRQGDGGFNSPWTWHFDPEATRLVESAIELCDGRPSYVEQHQSDYPTYCPWGARVISQR
jgi:hypothetical protein